MNRYRHLLHETFETGITLKGLGGVFETLGGVALWFIPPSRLDSFVRGLLEREAARHPHNFIAVHFVHLTGRLAHADPMFASLYLLSHGVVKVALVIALMRNKFWAYPLTIAVFGAFMAYQIYRYTFTHSFALAMLTIFDAAIVWLTWKEYGAQKAARQQKIASEV
ncbi:MAG: DUF2127 domain-containing protein [Candidatus Acidiferrales bacterium]